MASDSPIVALLTLEQKKISMLGRILLFLVLNFAALGIGSLFTASGAQSEWYQNLNKAPWTPPGWSFGAAWSFIMICLAFYMAWLWKRSQQKQKLLIFYGLQWLLNILWNPLFFYYHFTLSSLILIVLLTLLIAYGLWYFWRPQGWRSYFLLPYLLWLLIATSLNAYVVLFN